MARKFVVSLDLNKNELQNAVVQNLASAPGTPAEGQIYYDTVSNKLQYYNGSDFIAADGSSVSFGAVGNSAVGDSASNGVASSVSRSDHRHGRESFGSVTAETTFGLSSANGSAATPARSDHTHGTPAHGAAAHSAIKISDLDAPSVSVSFGSQKITSLADPTDAQDAATKSYVDAARSGLDVKQSARVASTANVSGTYNATGGTSARGQLTSMTNSIDGVTVANGDRVLLKNQSTGAQNGIWTVTTAGTGANGVWDRATDFDQDAEVTSGAFVFVSEGTANADTGWVLTTNDPIVVGGSSGTTLAWAQFSGPGNITAGAGLVSNGGAFDIVSNHAFITVNADNIDIGTLPVNKGGTGATDAAGARSNLGATTKFSTTIGDGVATSYNVDHNLATTSVLVQAFQVSDGAQIEPDFTRTTANRVVVGFATAPSTNSVTVVVIG